MTNVCAVNWGNKYSVDYTQRLYNMVKRNTTYEFNFYVLTDDVTRYDKLPHINAVEIDTDDTSWWCKMLMFKPGMLPPGEYLYLDLDVVILQEIDSLFEHKGFGIIRDFIRPDEGILDGKEYNSSLMRFNTTQCAGIYQYYNSNKKSWLEYQKQVHFFGDQNVISSYMNHYPDFCNPFPDNEISSFKKGNVRGATAGDRSEWFGRHPTPDVKVVVFHGDPSPAEILGNSKKFLVKGDKFCPSETIQWIENNWK